MDHTHTGSDTLEASIAVVNRDAMQSLLDARGVKLSPAAVAGLKSLIVRVLSPAATVVLLDGDMGAQRAAADGSVAPGVVLAIPLEAQGYASLHQVDITRVAEGWSAARARELGATACKLLLPFRVDDEAQMHAQQEVVREVLEDCRQAGLELILEPIVYELPKRKLEPSRFGALVVAGAGRLAGLGPDVLKVQYPGSRALCDSLHEAVAGTPWVILGGGADGDTLARQVAQACRAGARGCIVGRTLWEDALGNDPVAAGTVLREHSLPLLERLGMVARAAAVGG